MADKNSKMPGFMKAMFAKKAGKGGKKGKPFADGGQMERDHQKTGKKIAQVNEKMRKKDIAAAGYAKGGKVSKRYAGAGAVAATGTNTATTTTAPTTTATTGAATGTNTATTTAKPTTTAATTTAKPAMSFGSSARAAVSNAQARMQARSKAAGANYKNRFMAANRPTTAGTGTTTAGTGTTTGATAVKAKKGGLTTGKATKFGAAMKKKSADTMGRAMKKYAKGGSIDGIAKKGKTRTKYPSMKNGGMC